MTSWRIVADVGGTNVRFARAAYDGTISDVLVSPTSAFPTFLDALASYVLSAGGLEQCSGFAIGAAGPIENNSVQLTNGTWSIHAIDLSSHFGRPVRLINDLQAIALALPALGEADLTCLGDNRPNPLAPRLAVNIGTGFGASLLVPSASGATAVACEPGHMKLAVPTDLQRAVPLASPSVEQVLSGLALKTIWGQAEDPSKVTSVFAARDDATAGDGVERFSTLLGQVCGDLVLATGAWGGVYLCGSVATAWWASASFDAFGASFNDKGPMSSRMTPVAVALIRHPHAALVGLTEVDLSS